MRWVILERDGVINEIPAGGVKSPEQWVPLAGSLEAIAQLNQAGFRVALLTNQAGLGRHQLDETMLESIHAKMCAALAKLGGQIDAILVCPHGPEDSCACRTPKTGLYERFAREQQVDLHGVPVVVDALRDLQAAESVGAEPILVETGEGRRTLRRNPDLDVQTFVNLHEAAQYILFTYG